MTPLHAASRLSDLVRDGALNEILADLNHSADSADKAATAERVDSVRRALERLWRLLGAGQGRNHDRDGAVVAALGSEAPSPKGRSMSSRDPDAERLAALERAIHAALQRPDQKLAAYGTLVPGERNHHYVAGLGGAWQRCFVRGRRWTATDGDPGFLWNPDEPEIEAMLLVSDRLPDAWPGLDSFEGKPYQRHLVPVRAGDAHHVAYLYEAGAARRRKAQAISK